MPNVELYSHQIDAIRRMHNGCILCGGVGTGKSRTSLAYVYSCALEGNLKINGYGTWTPPRKPRDLYVITTAKKRDSFEWEREMVPFGLSTDQKICAGKIKVIIDSWNNIQKYKKVYGAVFIFDEQRVVGGGAWVKTFLKIARANKWILLTATPGDTWKDYIPVFIANGFYKSRTEFNTLHVAFKPFMNYPVIDHYVNEGVLLKHRRDILIVMEDMPNRAKKVNFKLICQYDKEKYKRVFKDRWDIYDDCPIEETGKLFYLLRKVVNEDSSRLAKVKQLMIENPKTIIFYNFTYELHALREIAKELKYDIGEWNGEVHSEVPASNRWVYLCQYTAAAEGWNCITTDTIIFYSQNYSYKTTAQAAGRIDRLNTPFKELHYYYLRSPAPIDLAIQKSLSQKKDFNEKIFLQGG
jgi:hypothetical protein